MKFSCTFHITILLRIHLWFYLQTISLWKDNNKVFPTFPAGIDLFKVGNGNAITMCEICSHLTIKKTELRYWHRSGVFIVNFQISQIANVNWLSLKWWLILFIYRFNLRFKICFKRSRRKNMIFLWGLSSICRSNVYRSALTLKNILCPENFQVAPLQKLLGKLLNADVLLRFLEVFFHL